MTNKYEDREYQREALRKVCELKPGDYPIILTIPTGGGKTFIGCEFIKYQNTQGRSCLFVVDRLSLLSQASKDLFENEIIHDVIQGQRKTLGFAVNGVRNAVASSQTLERNLELLEAFDVIIVDECHTIRPGFMNAITDERKRAYIVLGLTATPINKKLCKYYRTELINVTTTNKLIGQGVLVPVEAHEATAIDMSGKRKIAGEYTDNDVADAAGKITGDIVGDFHETATKLGLAHAKTLVFSANIAHGKELQEEFAGKGYEFGHLSYNSPDCERIIKQFHANDLQGLISCEKVGKGFNAPEVQILVCARTYASSTQAWLQMLGRLTRASKIIEKLVGHLFDHSGNYRRFYPAMDAFYQYGMDELETMPFRACAKCNIVFPTENKDSKFICSSCKPKPKPQWATKSTTELGPSGVEVSSGKLQEFQVEEDYKIWKQICTIGKQYLKSSDRRRLKKWAWTQYKDETGKKPKSNWWFVETGDPIDEELRIRVIRRYEVWKHGRNALLPEDIRPEPVHNVEFESGRDPQFEELVNSENWYKKNVKKDDVNLTLF